MKVPSWMIVALVAIMVFLGIRLVFLGIRFIQERPAEPAFVPGPSRTEIQYIIDTAGLGKYRDQVSQAIGDSLRELFASKAKQIRARSPRSPSIPSDTTILRDTVCLAGEDVRTVLIHDSSVIVPLDSNRSAVKELMEERKEFPEKLKETKRRGFASGVTYTATGAGIIAAMVLIWEMVTE